MKTRYREPSLFSSEVGKLSPAEEELLTRRTCDTCKHSKDWKAGFVHCEYMDMHHHVAGRSVCGFDPVRWEAKP